MNLAPNPYALISIVAALINAGAAILIFSRNPKATVNQLHTIVLLSLVWWGFAEAMLRMSVRVEQAYFWIAFGALSWIFIGALYLHFVLFFVGLEHLARKLWFLALLYLPGFFWLFIAWQTNWVISYELSPTPWGWHEPPGRLFGFLVLWLVSYFAVAFWLLFRFFGQTKSTELRAQVRLLLIGFLIPLISGLITDAGLSILGIRIPTFAVVAATFGAIFVVIAILRFRLFVFSPQVVLKDVLDSLSDALFLVDHKKLIQFANPATYGFLGFSQKELLGSPFDNLFPKGTLHQAEFDEFWQKVWDQKQSFKDIASFVSTKDGRDIPIHLSLSPVLTPEGQIPAAVVLLQDVSYETALSKKILEETKKLQETRRKLEETAGQLLRGENK